MKNYLKIPSKILMLSIALFITTACNTDDDINAIFRERTWNLTYIKSGSIKRYAKDKIYSIEFKNDNFTATMPNGATIKGKWFADGSEIRSFTCRNVVIDGRIKGDTIAENMYDLLQNARNYAGDTNWLQIKQDKNTYMQFYN